MTAQDDPSLLPWVALALLLTVAALIAGILVYTHRSRAKGTDRGTDPSDTLDRPLLRRLRHDVQRALARTVALTGAADGTYEVPWVLLVGFSGSRTGALASGLALAGGDHDAEHPHLADLSVRACRDGLLLDLPEDLLERPDWRRHWRSFLHSLAIERPERPLDGIVVAIAATDLAGPRKLAVAQLTARGEQLHELLWALQRRTGFRVPVYLVLTGAESLPGFAAWTRAVPDAARDGLLGCPAPHMGDGPVGDRFEQALRTLAARLGCLQLPLLMQGADTELVDGLLLFPGELEQLAAPLATLLGPCLRPSAYHDGVLFRGCFVAGDGADGMPAFARGLFERKVFAERGLAEPARGALGLRRRQIHLAQIALAALVLLGAVGLIRVGAKSAGVESVTLLLRTIESEVGRVGQAATDNGSALDEIRTVAAGNLIHRLGGVSISSAETIKAPTSLLSGADEQIERAIAVGYDVVILQAVHARLLSHFDEILADLGRPGAAPTPAATSETMRRLVEHETNLRRYERLAQLDVQALAGVAGYTLGITVPTDFHRHYRLYQDALADTAPPAIDRAASAQRIARALSESWADTVVAHYRTTPVARAVEGMTAPAAGDLDPLERLRGANTGLDQLARILEQPGSAWLTGAAGGLDAALEGLLVEVRDVAVAWGPPLDPSRLVEQLRIAGLAEQAAERERLVNARIFGISPGLVRAEQGLSLAPPLAKASAALTAYLGQPLLRDGGTAGRARPSRPGERLIWDVALLRELLMAAEGSLLADARDLVGLPPQLAELARQASAPALTATVEVALSRAQSADPAIEWSADRGLQREARAFATAEPLLSSLAQTLELAGLRNQAASLQLVMVGQARRLLEETDAALDRGAPYALIDPALGSWDGVRPLRLAAYGTDGAADLAASLPGRRAFVERLAEEHIEPILAVLAHSPTGLDPEDEERVARWSGTLEAIERFRRGDPASSLVRLERYLTTDLDAIGPDNCGAGDADQSLGWDYFADQLYAVQGAVALRCEALAAELASARYAGLAEAFNTTLAGRFPFTGTGAAAADAPKAAPDEVRRFFREQDAERDALSALLAAVLPPDVPETAMAFLTELGAARSLLAPIVDPPVPMPLSYEILAEFRAEPTRDRGGNQILEWSIETPAGRLSSLAGGESLTWTAGQPVRLALRWARNAPSLPVARPGGMPKVEGPVAVFEYRDPWALLSLLRIHASGATDDGPALSTLAFSVPLAPNPDAAPGGQAGLDQAEVFLRVRLTALTQMPGEPVRRTLLPSPRLPAVAPDVEAPVAAFAGPRHLVPSPAAGP